VSGTDLGIGTGTDREGEISDVQMQLMEQEKMILQLKEMIRDREKALVDKEGELKVC
jgi:hypothetical protein